MIRGCLGGVRVGDGCDVVVMGAINVSPESFYAGSVATSRDELLRVAEGMAEGGAALLDVGAMATAPYRQTAISPEEEAERLGAAIALLSGKLGVPLSADTSRAIPARAALEAGARVINDVRGLTGDPGLGQVVSRAQAGLVVMASERASNDASNQGGHDGAAPVEVVLGLLEESVRLALQAGIAAHQIAIDPGIGFFRDRGMAWHEWDCRVLACLPRLRTLGRPVCLGVSRKSFIGALAGVEDPAGRLPGSLAATAAGVLGGAHVIRTHDVAETRQAVRVAEAVRRAREAAP